MSADMNERDTNELISHYNKWRQIYRYADNFEPNEPDWDDGRLYFRKGYPHPDWSALILASAPDGHYKVLHASTERRNTPIESTRAVFSRVEDAGKYIIYEVGDLLRVSLGLVPLEQKWRDAGLDEQVSKIILSDKQARYELRRDESAYFVAYSGGVQPYNHILALSYDQLDSELLDGFSESLITRIAADSS
jgi:hypothetical protein